MLSKESFEAFKKQYKEEHGKDLSDDEALAIVLFENAVLHAQNFIFRLEQEKGEIETDAKMLLAEDISSYSLSLIMIYLAHNNKFSSLRPLILDEHEKFIRAYSGTTDEKKLKNLKKFLLEKLHRNIMWLLTPFEKRAVIEKIASKISSIPFKKGEFFSVRPLSEHKLLVEKLVFDVEGSMKHFGIIN